MLFVASELVMLLSTCRPSVFGWGINFGFYGSSKTHTFKTERLGISAIHLWLPAPYHAPWNGYLHCFQLAFGTEFPNGLRVQAGGRQMPDHL